MNSILCFVRGFNVESDTIILLSIAKQNYREILDVCEYMFKAEAG
jgi:hypothetical protein